MNAFGVSTGTELPPLDIALDRTMIVAAAIASQDFEDVHHDPGKARERGTPDIFLSINSTNGLLNRYVTDWAGPGSRITATSLRLGVPAFPGDTLRFTGTVGEAAPGEVTLSITGSNARGAHVTATVTVAPTAEPDTGARRGETT
ncbi:acyl dehydratase [Prauserella marina]|uniref:MaoC like domain-containing protein n=1 Tax=Prauserella marina TaxID=530584 RepID=A0A222VQT7_9PSEU|nr:MaoC/PaaZ C-terminal domain-containing protein [Prauserella marina]ASR36279.1 acyl dehydratase [Prauserella marina]PWV77055.1 MaoC dehydratase-like protein [Prauserella marina]SDD03357.1 MaoC like domain-containing protein [Prauserella marina]